MSDDKKDKQLALARERARLIKEIEANGLNARGKKELIAHLKGEKIKRSAAMRAQCYQCMGYFTDGREECIIETCPMYEYRSFKHKGEDETETEEVAETEEGAETETKEVETKKMP